MDEAVEIALFKELKKRIIESVPYIKSVEIDNSQETNENKERPRLYPFVTLNIAVNWLGAYGYNTQSTTTSGQSNGVATIVLKYIYESLDTETNSWLEHKAILHKIYRAIMNIETVYIYGVERESSVLDSSHNRVAVLVDTYNASIVEAGFSNLVEINAGSFSIETNNELIIDDEIIRTGRII